MPISISALETDFSKLVIKSYPKEGMSSLSDVFYNYIIISCGGDV